jgi:hypothetical protein
VTKQSIVEAVANMTEQELREYVVKQAQQAEKAKAARKAYMQRNKDKRKAYSQKRNARIREVLRRAKELGIQDEVAKDEAGDEQA